MTRFTVTHPDATVSVRNSKTRTYTHAVEVRETEAHEIWERTETIKVYKGYLAEETNPAYAEDYRKRIAAHEVALAEVATPSVTYWVAQWSSTPAAAAKATSRWNRIVGMTARVVQVDA